MSNEKITYRLHAVQRMFERKVSAEEVRYVLETGEVIEENIQMTHPTQVA